MKRIQIILAFVLLVAPPVARSLWFYQGVYQRSQPVATPEYGSIQVPVPPVNSEFEGSQPAEDQAVAQNAAGKTTTVVVDAGHGNLYALSEIQPLTDAISRNGGKLVIADALNPSLPQYKAADAYLVIAPAAGFAIEEIAAVQNLVRQGGRLVVMVDPTRNGGSSQYSAEAGPLNAVSIANQLLEPFELAFSDDYLYNLTNNEANFRNIRLSNFAANPATEGLDEVIFYSALSLSAAPQALIRGDEETLSSLTDQGGMLAVAGSDLQGRVLALGDISFMTVPYIQVAGNSRLVENLAAFLTSGPRDHGLADYPYLFRNPVKFLMPEGGKVSAGKTAALGLIHTSLGVEAGALAVVSEPAAGIDLVVPATYSEAQGAGLETALKGFDLEFKEADSGMGGGFLTTSPEAMQKWMESLTETPEAGAIEDLLEALPTEESGMDDQTGEEDSAWLGTVKVPGFGTIDANGNGLILLERSSERTLLALLAGSTDALQELAGLVNSGDFSSCAVLDRTAVCPLSPASDTGGY